FDGRIPPSPDRHATPPRCHAISAGFSTRLTIRYDKRRLLTSPTMGRRQPLDRSCPGALLGGLTRVRSPVDDKTKPARPSASPPPPTRTTQKARRVAGVAIGWLQCWAAVPKTARVSQNAHSRGREASFHTNPASSLINRIAP